MNTPIRTRLMSPVILIPFLVLLLTLVVFACVRIKGPGPDRATSSRSEGPGFTVVDSPTPPEIDRPTATGPQISGSGRSPAPGDTGNPSDQAGDRVTALATVQGSQLPPLSAPPSGSGGPPPEQTYEFTLPNGDISIENSEVAVYRELRAGACGQAQRSLDGSWPSMSPRNVLLYQAAVELCQGNSTVGQFWFQQAGDEYGWDGMGPFPANPPVPERQRPSCEVYMSARSVLDQRPRSDFTCLDGTEPKWGSDKSDPRLSAPPPSP